MSITYSLTIGGTEFKSYIRRESFLWNTNKNGQPDTLQFEIYTENTALTLPSNEDEVILTINGTVRFQGNLVQQNLRIISKDIRSVQCVCHDFSRNANKGEPIAEIYEDQTVDYIINDIVTRYSQLSGYTQNNVDCPITIDYIFIGFKSFTQVLKSLADRVGYDFYIDKDKDIHFTEIGTESAPYNLEADNQTYINDTLRLRNDGLGIINMLDVRGGLYEASEQSTETFSGNASDTEFDLAALYVGGTTTLTVGGVPQTVGAFGINDDELGTTYDALYDYNGRRIIFAVAPASGTNNIVWVGKKYLRVFIRVKDSASIASRGGDPSGVFHQRISNNDLKTKESARQFGQAYLAKYSQDAYDGDFQTHKTYFRAGQSIILNHSVLGVNKEFIIQSTSTRIYSDERFITNVRLASAESIDAVAILARMINNMNDQGSSTETLELFEVFDEQITVTDAVFQNQNQYTVSEQINVTDAIAQTENMSISWVHTPYTPTAIDDTNKVMLHDSSPLHT